MLGGISTAVSPHKLLFKMPQNGFFLCFKFTKFNFGWGLRPRPLWGSTQHSPSAVAEKMGGKGPPLKYFPGYTNDILYRVAISQAASYGQ